MTACRTLARVPRVRAVKTGEARFVKPLRGGLRLRPAVDVPGAELDRATQARVRKRLVKIDEARIEADQKSRDSYLG